MQRIAVGPAFMKQSILLVSFLLAGMVSYAQTSSSSGPSGKVKVADKIGPTATVLSFESSLVTGNLSLIKTLVKGETKEFAPVYHLSKSNDASFNNRQPIQISLSRQSFDSVFSKTNAELAGKWNQLNKYVENNKIVLSEERGWVAVISYFNSL